MNKPHVVKYMSGESRIYERFATRPEAEERAAALIAAGGSVTIKSEGASGVARGKDTREMRDIVAERATLLRRLKSFLQAARSTGTAHLCNEAEWAVLWAERRARERAAAKRRRRLSSGRAARMAAVQVAV